MTTEDLKAACVAFEAEHGTEAFMEALSLIMEERLQAHGYDVVYPYEAEEQSEA
jgi:hypothetical protein